MPAGLEELRLPVESDVSLHALAWPDGNGTPFLLVHGLSSNARTWEAVAGILHDEGHPVAAVDLRGHGRSDKPDDGYDFATLTADLSAAIDVLGFDRPVVAGQSTGGNLAVELAYREPERISGVVGVDGGAIELHRRWPRWEDCERALAPPHFDGVLVDEFAEIVRRQHPDWSEWGVAATVANCEVRPDGTIRPWLTRERHLRLLRSLWEHRPSRILPELTVPLLLINAENEAGLRGPNAMAGLTDLRQEEAAAAGSAGSHVRVEWLVGDHDLHVQHPRQVAELLLDAVRDSRGRS